MRQSSTVTTRSYRIYLRDSENTLAVGHDIDFASDHEARQHAAQMLDRQAAHPCAEVWDRSRLVCIVRKDGIPPATALRGGLSQPIDRPALLSEPPPSPR